ncbi:DegV family protein [Salipaludibacillus agaradhaerens]|uniref:DegV family protein n=1 Tax=Salipaludibacillus agaradhaerens TaxID=76935 RepID=A0A9Q4B1H2_SALAG|nr:DegV family protein [Salipaludibacillus agaradhaerens]MCR6096446.1 DegV family protein [Salipaludibacillus agaradhaerens]MCR6113995.1 DegV family protein [Salipaludibacillus agaradhaerens]
MSKKVKIVTDSTLDIPKEAIEELGITIVPLSVTVDGKSYLDGVDVTSSEFVKLLVNSKDIPQSSQPSAGSFLEVYDELGQDGSSIISIHMTSGMSGTVASARTAADMTEADVTVVDSQFISIALSFQVKEAARLANEGKNVEEIIERLNDVRKNSSLYIMVDTLEYLLKGGRIGRGRALVGSLLKIKPIASLEDGVYTPVTKVRTHLQMINFMKKKFQEEAAGKIVKGIGIAQVEAQDLARQVKDAIKEVSGFEDISIIETTPIVSTHTGPGALALMYYFDEK